MSVLAVVADEIVKAGILSAKRKLGCVDLRKHRGILCSFVSEVYRPLKRAVVFVNRRHNRHGDAGGVLCRDLFTPVAETAVSAQTVERRSDLCSGGKRLSCYRESLSEAVVYLVSEPE